MDLLKGTKSMGRLVLTYLKHIIFLGLFFILMTLAELPMMLAEDDTEIGIKAILSDQQAFKWLLVNTLLIGLFFIWRYRKQLSQSNPNHYGTQTVDTKKKIFITLSMIVLYFVSDYFWGWLMPTDSPENQVMIETSFKQLPLTIAFITCIFAPLTEEFIFRGFFFNYFFNKNNRYCHWLVIIISGLVFGLLHEAAFTPALLVYASSGWILGLTYFYTKDLRCSMFVHFVGNAFATLIMLLTL